MFAVQGHVLQYTFLQAGNGFEELHRHMKHGTEFCKDLENLFSERYINTHNMYARTHIQHAHTHRTGMSYRKSLLAVGGVLEFLKTRVSVCTAMVDSLLSAVQQSQVCITDPSGDY